MRVSLHNAKLHYGGGFALHTASSGKIAHLSEIYLKLDDGETVGVGEVRANIAYLNGLAEETVLKDVTAAIRAIDWRRDPAELLASVDEWGKPFLAPVKALIDCALHDFLARRAGKTVAASIGAGPGDVKSLTNQTLFWSSFDDFIARARAYVARGYTDLKVRVAAGDFSADLRRIAELRRAFGDGIKLAADANGRWSATEAIDKLEALSAFDISYIEQPIAPGDWAAIDRLAARSPIPVMLDESVGTLADVSRICGYAGRILAHLKLVKLGGIAPTMAAARQLSAARVPFMIGQMNEGAVATAAALHVACAARPAFAELYGADGLIDDPASGLSYSNGAVQAPNTPGLGVDFDAAATQPIGEF